MHARFRFAKQKINAKQNNKIFQIHVALQCNKFQLIHALLPLRLMVWSRFCFVKVENQKTFKVLNFDVSSGLCQFSWLRIERAAQVKSKPRRSTLLAVYYFFTIKPYNFFFFVIRVIFQLYFSALFACCCCSGLARSLCFLFFLCVICNMNFQIQMRRVEQSKLATSQ